MQSEPLLPIIPGCMAMVIHGDQTGAILNVERALTDREVESLSKYCDTFGVRWFMCNSDEPIQLHDPLNGMQYTNGRASCWPEHWLMRINGNSLRFQYEELHDRYQERSK